MHKCREWQSFTRVSGMKTGEVIPFWHKMSLALNTESKAQFYFELNIDSYLAGTTQIKDISNSRKNFDEWTKKSLRA